jgi:Leucine-rich repeat (LRR) protein
MKDKMRLPKNWRILALITLILCTAILSCDSSTDGDTSISYNNYHGDSIAIQSIIKSNTFDTGFLHVITTDSGHQDFERIGKRVIAIYLDWAGIKNLPREIRFLTELELLTLNGNNIETLPPEIGELKGLRRLIMGGNKLEKLPNELTKLVDLNTLTFPENKLVSLPKDIGNLSSLRTFYLSDNELSDLPSTIVKIKNLGDGLRINGNKLCHVSAEIKSWIDEVHDSLADWKSEQRCN